MSAPATPPPPRPSPTDPSAVRAYRDLNRALLSVLLLTAAWTFGRLALASVMPASAATCPSRGWLGVDCPLCGLTRGTVALLRGDLAGAVLWNPLTPAMALFLALETLYRAWGSRASGARRLAPWRHADRLLHLTLAGLYLLYSLGAYLVRLSTI